MNPSAWTPIADGPAGIAQIVANLNAAKDYYGSLPVIRSAALTISNPTVDDDDAGNVQRLEAFVKNALIYVKDPINSELTQTPDVLLLQIQATGQARGDCDDHVLLFASLVESLGIFCSIVGVKSPGSSTFDHVIAIAYPNDTPTQIDLCSKVGPAPTYTQFLQ